METSVSAPPRRRVESVDVVRGIIMVIMALDHTRDYFGAPGSPTDLSQATAALFMTRWITNICAPVFFLLTGTGAYLSLGRKTKGELSRFLVTRGLWLIFLDAVLFRCLVVQFNFDYHVTVITVLWALGWAMIVLSALVYLPVSVVTGFGVGLIAAHNLLDGVRSSNLLWTFLHSPNFVVNMPGHAVFLAYPVVPWIGVTAVGYGLGQVHGWDAVRRRRFLLRCGVLTCALFVILRAVNVYGDPSRWSEQKTALYTVLSFLNTTKYPPSLLFLLMTLGPALLLLWWFDGRMPRAFYPALIVGRVPMFYYLLHFFLIHLLAVIVCLVRFHEVRDMFLSPDMGHFPVTQPTGWGLTLAGVYLVWVMVVAASYPFCRRYAEIKLGGRNRWLSYL